MNAALILEQGDLIFQQAAVRAQTHSWSKYREQVTVECSALNGRDICVYIVDNIYTYMLDLE